MKLKPMVKIVILMMMVMVTVVSMVAFMISMDSPQQGFLNEALTNGDDGEGDGDCDGADYGGFHVPDI